MKNKFISAMLLLASFAFASAAGENLEKCGARIIIYSPVEISDASAAKDVKISRFENGDQKVLTAERFNSDPNAWEDFSLSITPPQDGILAISLSGSVGKNKDGSPAKLAVLVDDVRIDGKPVENGSFEKGFEGWYIIKDSQPRLTFGEGMASEGRVSARIFREAPARFSFIANKGVPVVISARTKPYGNLKNVDDDVSIDLSKFANDRFGSGFDDSKREYEYLGVKFKIPAPDQNSGKSSLTFNTAKKNVKLSAAEVNFEKRNVSGRFLYVLLTSSNPDRANNNNIGAVLLQSVSGAKVKHVITYGANVGARDARDANGTCMLVFVGEEDGKKQVFYMAKFPLFDGDALKTLRIESYSLRKLEILAATVSDKDIITFRTFEPKPDEWTKADIPEDMTTLAGSALDMSAMAYGGEAGSHGRMVVSERGTLVFEKEPSKDLRLRGFTASIPQIRGCKTLEALRAAKPEIRKGSEEYAKLISRGGYNYLRIGFDFIKNYKAAEIKSELLDEIDYFFAQLKKNGVYIHLPLMWYDSGEKTYVWELHDDVKLRTVFGEPVAWECWRKTAEEQLNHVNPYTGIAWKDDPMFGIVEYYNELEICFGRLDRASPETKTFILGKFSKWLEQKYGTVEKLNAEWNKSGFVYNSGTFKYKSFGEIGVPFVKNPDWMNFCWENYDRFVAFARKIVDDTGYKGLIAQLNMQSSPIANFYRARYTDVVIKNTYFSHPSNFQYFDVGCPQKSSLEFPMFFLGIASSREYDRPMGITEYNHCFWNRYRYEFPALLPAYAAFQNYSFMIIHANAVPVEFGFKNKNKTMMTPFLVSGSPISRATEVFTNCFFVRGDVSPADRRVDMSVTKEDIADSIRSVKAFNNEQVKIALITGFATESDTPKREAVKKVRPSPADLKIVPAGSSEMRMEAWFQDVVAGSEDGFDFAKFTDVLRKKKILSADNKTDAAKGIYQTCTGQITLETEKRAMRISTPKSQLAVLSDSEPIDLGDLKIISTSVSASIGVCSLDGRDISSSSRLLLAYCTLEANEGMKTTLDYSYAITLGKGPILIKNGILNAELKLDASKKFAVYPLALNGQRRAKISAQSENGTLKLNIDNSTLPDGSTVMFEIVAE